MYLLLKPAYVTITAMKAKLIAFRMSEECIHEQIDSTVSVNTV